MGIDGDDKSTSDEILTSKEGSIAADDAVVTMGGGAVGRWGGGSTGSGGSTETGSCLPPCFYRCRKTHQVVGQKVSRNSTSVAHYHYATVALPHGHWGDACGAATTADRTRDLDVTYMAGRV